MLINLVADRFRGLKSKGTPLSQSAIENPKSKTRTVFPETGAMRREEKIAASVPDTERRKQSLLAGFEEMLAAYTSLVMRDLRD